MTNKLPICAVIRADSIASEWNGITHLASRVPFVLLYSPRRPFNFSLNARFSINTTSYFVGCIGCNVPCWYFFLRYLKIRYLQWMLLLYNSYNYSSKYFCYVLLCLEWFAQSFKKVSRTYFRVSVGSLKTLSKS